MKKLSFALFLAFIACKKSNSIIAIEPPKVIPTSSIYVDYQKGNLPIIITAPHGGYLKPTTIIDRSCTNCSYVQDANTQELARTIDSLFFVKTGCHTHLIINRLHRIKFDANREISEAAVGNLTVENLWKEYNQNIENAQKEIIKKYGKGLLLDIHGHGHTIQRLEIGYLLSDADLQKSDKEIEVAKYLETSSIRNITKQNLLNQNFSQLLRGKNSLGTLLQKAGYPSVPSEEMPSTKNGESYFSGGYTTQTHGSLVKGTIDAIQIEHNFTNVRDSEVNRRKYATVLTNTINQYMKDLYFGEDLSKICH